MPEQGIPCRDREEILTFEEITRLVGLFAQMGVNKVRLTGGEPLVRRNIDKLVQSLAAVPGIETLAMTTNGVLLEDYAIRLKAAGLNRLNVSLDSLRPERYRAITLRDEHHRVLIGIEAASAAGIHPLKINVVVIRGENDDELADFVEFARDKQAQVRFIEYMPFKNNRWLDGSFISGAEMLDRLRMNYTLLPLDSEQNSGSVAREYRIPDHRFTVGFISAMSDHFCYGCNRLRLTADGGLKTCLFFPAEVNLRQPLREGAPDEIICKMIGNALSGKRQEHPPNEQLRASSGQNMIQIGG